MRSIGRQGTQKSTGTLPDLSAGVSNTCYRACLWRGAAAVSHNASGKVSRPHYGAKIAQENGLKSYKVLCLLAIYLLALRRTVALS